MCALLDCALGFFPCYFLFGCNRGTTTISTARVRYACMSNIAHYCCSSGTRLLGVGGALVGYLRTAAISTLQVAQCGGAHLVCFLQVEHSQPGSSGLLSSLYFVDCSSSHTRPSSVLSAPADSAPVACCGAAVPAWPFVPREAAAAELVFGCEQIFSCSAPQSNTRARPEAVASSGYLQQLWNYSPLQLILAGLAARHAPRGVPYQHEMLGRCKHWTGTYNHLFGS